MASGEPEERSGGSWEPRTVLGRQEHSRRQGSGVGWPMARAPAQGHPGGDLGTEDRTGADTEPPSTQRGAAMDWLTDSEAQKQRLRYGGHTKVTPETLRRIDELVRSLEPRKEEKNDGSPRSSPPNR